MATCRTSPATPNPDPKTSPPKRSRAARGAEAAMRRLNIEAPELRIAEVARTQKGLEFLQRKLGEEYFMRYMAQASTLNPHQGKNFSTWMARHFPFLSTGDAKKVRAKLVQDRLLGESLVDTFRLSATDTQGNIVRIKVAQLYTDSYKRIRKTLKKAGVPLPKDQLDRLWLDAIELGRTPVLVRQLQDGQLTTKAQRLLNRKHQRFVDKLSELGLGDETRKLLLEEAENINGTFEDLHQIADLAGLEVGDVTQQGIGYFPRVMSEDFKFRLSRLDPEVRKALQSDPNRAMDVVRGSLYKSRTTHDFLVEDELLLAANLGLVDEAKVRSLQKTISEGPGQATETLSDLTYKWDTKREGMEYRHRTARELAERKLEKARTDANTKHAEVMSKLPTSRDPVAAKLKADEARDKTIQRAQDRLDKLTAKQQAEARQYEVDRQKAFEGFDASGGREQASQQLEDLVTEATQKLATLIDEDGVLVGKLSELPVERLEALVDSGILSKVPVTTTELADRLIAKHGLPYSGIDELLITDPHQAYNLAKEQAKRRMGQSVMLRGMYRDGIQNGWMVNEATKLADPNTYKGWAKLDRDLLVDKFGVNPEHIPPQGLYVHPVVEEQLLGILHVATDPATQNTLARVWQYTWKLAKEQVLTTTGFLGRQVWQLFIQGAMSGTNLARIIPSMGDWARYGKQGLEAFDDVAKVYAGGTMTQREMVSRAIQLGFLDSHQAVGLGQAVVKSAESGSSLDPRSLHKALNKWGSIGTKYGVLPQGVYQWDFVEYGAGLLGRASNDAAAHVMSWGVWLEQAYKLAYLDTVLKGGGGDALAQLLVGRQPKSFASIEEAIKHGRDYFLDYSDRGAGDLLISKNVAPFWMYMSRSVPATVRHVLRHPGQYVTMQRLYHLASEDFRESEMNAQGALPPWYRGQTGTIYLPHPNDPDRFIHIPLASVDPVADVTNRLDGIANAFGEAVGIWGPDGPQGFVDEAEKATGGGATAQLIDAMLGQTFGPAKTLLGVITKRDPYTGRSLVRKAGEPDATLAGLRVPGGELSPMTKFLVEQTLPAVANLNRWNPGGVFGRRERTNAAGEVILPETPSPLTGEPRYDRDNNYVPDLTSANPMWQLLRSTGITVNSIDSAVSMQFTVNDMNRAAKEVRRRYGQVQSALEDNPPPSLAARLEAESVALAALYVELETGKIGGTQWLNHRGYKSFEEQRKDEEAAKRKLEQQAKRSQLRANQIELLTNP